jgi:hypothetical protein
MHAPRAQHDPFAVFNSDFIANQRPQVHVGLELIGNRIAVEFDDGRVVAATGDDVPEFELWKIDGLKDGVLAAWFEMAGAVGIDEFDNRVLSTDKVSKNAEGA